MSPRARAPAPGAGVASTRPGGLGAVVSASLRVLGRLRQGASRGERCVGRRRGSSRPGSPSQPTSVPAVTTVPASQTIASRMSGRGRLDLERRLVGLDLEQRLALATASPSAFSQASSRSSSLVWPSAGMRIGVATLGERRSSTAATMPADLGQDRLLEHGRGRRGTSGVATRLIGASR